MQRLFVGQQAHLHRRKHLQVRQKSHAMNREVLKPPPNAASVNAMRSDLQPSHHCTPTANKPAATSASKEPCDEQSQSDRPWWRRDDGKQTHSVQQQQEQEQGREAHENQRWGILQHRHGQQLSRAPPHDAASAPESRSREHTLACALSSSVSTEPWRCVLTRSHCRLETPRHLASGRPEWHQRSSRRPKGGLSHTHQGHTNAEMETVLI